MKNKKMFRLLISCIIAVFLSACQAAEIADAPEIIVRTEESKLDTEPVIVGDLYSIKQAIGVVTQVTEAVTFERSSRSVGRAFVYVGDRVKKGDVLATLDVDDLYEQIEQLTQEIYNKEQRNKLDDEKSLYDIAIANIELSRMIDQNHDEKAVQDKTMQIEMMELELRQRQEQRLLTIQRDYQRIDEITADIQRYQIIAPQDGVVTYITDFQNRNHYRVNIPYAIYLTYDSEFFIQNELNDALNASILSNYLFGREIEANIDGRTYKLEHIPLSKDEVAKFIARTGNQEPNGTQQPIRYKILNPDENLELGQQALVSVRTAYVPDAVIVPKHAVYKDKTQGDYVYIVKDGTQSMQPVTVGIRTSISCEIRSGLYGGETIVIR